MRSHGRSPRLRHPVRLGALVAAVAAAALLGSGRAAANQTIYVADTTQLQAALQSAADGDVIQLAPTTYFLGAVGPGIVECEPLSETCLPWQPQITASVTILGSTTGASVIDGDRDLAAGWDQQSVFEIDGDASVTISHVTIKNAMFGIDDESAGPVTLDHSTITGTGYAAFYEDSGGLVTMTNDTIAGNDGPDGPYDRGVEIDTGDLQATNVTIADNAGYGLDVEDTALVQNSIVANNALADCGGWGVTGVSSFDSDGSCASSFSGFTTSSSLDLGPLADDGGLSSTIALGSGSDAIGAGDASVCPSDDQRDYLRLSGCDAGAFQANGVSPVSDSPPVCSDGSESGTVDAAITGTVGCTDPDAGDSITVSQVAGPQHGQVTLNADGSFTYTPDSGFAGDDSFTFDATDSAGAVSATATESISVVDREPPTIAAPPDVTATAAPFTTSATVDLGTPTTGDDVGVVSVTRSPAGDSFPVGTTTVTWTAADAAGNTAQATQQVTVLHASVAGELAALGSLIDSWDLGKPVGDRFDRQISRLETAQTAGRTNELCAGLPGLARLAQSSLPSSEAAQVVADEQAIAADAGC